MTQLSYENSSCKQNFGFGCRTTQEAAERVADDKRAHFRALSADTISNDLAARLKVGPSQNLHESYFSAAPEVVPSLRALPFAVS